MLRLLRIEIEKLLYSRLFYTVLGLFLLYAAVMLVGFRAMMRRLGMNTVESQSGSMFLYVTLSLSFYPLVVTVANLFAGGSVSQERRAGTLKYNLIGPATRWQYLTAKWLVTVLATGACMLFLFIVLGGVGTTLFGHGNVLSYDLWAMAKPDPRMTTLLNEAETLQRCMIAVPLMLLSAMAVATPAFVVSTLVSSPMLAIAIPLSLFFICSIIQFSPFLSEVKPYLPTRHMFFWDAVFARDIPWSAIGEGVAFHGGAVALGLAVALAVFVLRDVEA